MARPRQLVTIGDLTRAAPLQRTRQRRQAMIGLVDMGAATSTTAGGPLQDAAMTLLNKFDAQGVTPEHTADAEVGAFQDAWNADPANATDQIGVDSEYGPVTQGALTAIVGGVAPPVNFGGGLNPTPTPTPGTTPATTTSSHLGLWLLIAAAGVGAYLLLRKKRRRGARRAKAATSI